MLLDLTRMCHKPNVVGEAIEWHVQEPDALEVASIIAQRTEVCITFKLASMAAFQRARCTRISRVASVIEGFSKVARTWKLCCLRGCGGRGYFYLRTTTCSKGGESGPLSPDVD